MTSKYSKASQHEVEKEVKKYNQGTAHSGKGGHTKVQSHEQAIAIGLSKARQKGLKVPEKKESK